MFLQQLQKQLIRDLKASWKKTAALGVLLVIGMFCWIPPLLKSESKVPVAAVPATIPLPIGVLKKQAEPADKTTRRISWKEIEKELKEDKLWQSAEVAAISSRPFEMDYDQFAPPVLFAKEGDFSDQQLFPTVTETEQENSVSNPQQNATSNSELTELNLTTTLLSSRRKLAGINGKFYREGDAIPYGETECVLTSIHHKFVVLTVNGEPVELKLRTKSEKNQEESPAVPKDVRSSNSPNTVIRVPLP